MKNKFKKSVFLLSSLMMLSVGAGIISGVDSHVDTVEAAETKTYNFSSYAAGTQYAQGEEHELDEIVTLTINGAHLNTQVRLYDGSNAVLKVTDDYMISAFTAKAGNKAATLNIYGSSDGEAYTLVGAQSTTTTYTNYTFDLSSIDNCKYVKMESKGAQIRVSECSLTFDSIGGGGTTTTYTVSFDTDGGNEIDALTDISSGAGITLPTPTKEGNTFNGWYIGDDKVGDAGESYIVTGNVTLKASWTPNNTGDTPIATTEVTYIFSDYTAGLQYAENEEHVLDSKTTVYTTECHFTSELRIYSSATHNGFAIFKFDDSISVSSIGFNAGNNNDTVNVYGSNDNGTTWTLVKEVAVTSTYTDYTIDLSTSYKSIKLDVAGTKQVRLKSFTICYSEIDNGGSDAPDVTEYVIKYNVNSEKGTIVGDAPTSTTGEVTLPNVSVTNETLYEFKGWYIGEDQSTLYEAGQTVTVSENTTFTALIEDKEVEESDYKLVTDASTLKAGDRIVIAAKDYEYALSTNQKTSNRGQAAVVKTSSGSSITFGDDVQVLTLENGVVDKTFALSTGEGYLYAASSGSNHLKTSPTLDANGSWSITVADDGTATIVAQGSNTRNTIQYNQSSSLFSCYGSASQKAVVLYNGGPDKTCTVTIDVNGGTLDSNVETPIIGDINAGVSGTLPISAQVTVPSTYSSYGITPTFVGWSDGSTVYEPGANYTVNVTTTFKAVYEYNSSYNLSIENAIAICGITGNTNTEFNITTTGSVTSIDKEYSSEYNNIEVTISDGSNSIKVYRLIGGENLKVGDEITVTGKLINYNGNTPEFAQGCTYKLESEYVNISYQYDLDSNPDAIRFISTINLNADDIESLSYRFNKKGVPVEVDIEKIYKSINGQPEFTQVDGTYYAVYAISGLQAVKGESFEVTLTITMADGTIYTASRSLTLGN